MSSNVVMTNRGAGVAVVECSGPVDASTQERLRDAALRCVAQKVRRVVLDLRRVEQIDVPGMASIAAIAAHASRSDVTVVLREPGSPSARRLLEHAGLCELLAS